MTEPEHRLSAADAEFLREHSGVRAATEEELADLAERTAERDADVRRFSLPSTKAAVWLGVSEREVLGLTAAGDLYAHTLSEGERRWPGWQFADACPLPHLAAVIAAIPAGTHPTAIRTLMTTPHPGLVYALPLGHPVQLLIPAVPLSPAGWLGDGGSPEPVLAILAAFAGAI